MNSRNERRIMEKIVKDRLREKSGWLKIWDRK